jgi:small subunit ribosomal protein S20
LANHKSAIKRARQNEVRRLRNKTNRTRVKNIIKTTRSAAGAGPEESQEKLREAMRVIDRAASKGAMHRKTASRRIARLSRHLFKAQSGDAS